MDNFDLRKYLAEGKLLKEALNKPLKEFGMDLKKRLEANGFNVKLTQGLVPDADKEHIKNNPNDAVLGLVITPDSETIELKVNISKVKEAEKAVKYFSLSDFNGPVLTKGWTTKQVKNAFNPGDVVLQDSQKRNGTWYFYRLPVANTKTVTNN